MKESAPAKTQLARLMATNETSSPKNFQLAFRIEDESVTNARTPKRQIKLRRIQPSRDEKYFEVSVHLHIRT